MKDAHAGLATVATAIAQAKSSITAITLEETKPDPTVRVTALVRDRNHLVHVMRTVRQTDVVLKVRRVLEEVRRSEKKDGSA